MQRLVQLGQQQSTQAEVLCTNCLEQAYHMAMERSVDLFLLDINLNQQICGDASGMRFAAHIREVERYHFTPIIFITGLEDPELYAYRDIGCYYYAEKPYDQAQLATNIREALAIPMDSVHSSKETIYFRQDGILLRLCRDEIVYIKNGRYGREVYTTSTTYHLSYQPFRHMLPKLDSGDFLRCSRSVIVNRKHIETIDVVNRYVTFHGRTDRVEIGPAFKKSFLRRATYA